MRSESGVSLIGFLVILLLLILFGVIAGPLLLPSGNPEAEAKAIAMLKHIYVAQQDFYGGRRHYGTEQQLRDFGVLTVSLVANTHVAASADGPFAGMPYNFAITANGSRQRWCAAAMPMGSGRAIAIDESGQTRTGASCDGGVMR